MGNWLPNDMEPGENMGMYLLRKEIEGAEMRDLRLRLALGLGFVVGLLAVCALLKYLL